MKRFKFSATLYKAQHKKVVSSRGCRNVKSYPLGNGDTYEAGALVLLGFEGTYYSDRKKYVGHLVCRLAQPSDDERDLIDFAELHCEDNDGSTDIEE